MHGSPTVLRQTSHPYTKAAGRLPVQSGIDRFSGLGAKLRNKNKKSRPPLFVPTLHNASYIPSKRSPAGKEDSVRSSVDWAQFKAKKRGVGRDVFFLGTWTGFKSTAQTVSQPHWSLTQSLHWPVSPFSTGDDGLVCVFCPQLVRKTDQEPIWTALDKAVEA